MKKLKQMYRCMEEWKYRNNKTTRCPTKTFGHDRRCGFTLVELVITIAIVIILSVISVPIYRGYVDKAKWSEAYALFGTIMQAQKAYYSEYGTFLDVSHGGTGSFSLHPVFGIDARGNKYFSRFNIDNGVNPTKGFNAVIYLPEEFKTKSTDNMWLKYSVTRGATIFVGHWNDIPDWND